MKNREIGILQKKIERLLNENEKLTMATKEMMRGLDATLVEICKKYGAPADPEQLRAGINAAWQISIDVPHPLPEFRIVASKRKDTGDYLITCEQLDSKADE